MEDISQELPGEVMETVWGGSKKSRSQEKLPMRARIQNALEAKGHVKLKCDFTHQGKQHHLKDLVIKADGAIHIYELDYATEEPLSRRTEQPVAARITYYTAFGWEIIE